MECAARCRRARRRVGVEMAQPPRRVRCPDESRHSHRHPDDRSVAAARACRDTPPAAHATADLILRSHATTRRVSSCRQEEREMCTASVRLRLLIIAAVVAVSLWAVSPPAEKINLGLDLRGGLQLILRVRTEDALRQQTRAAAEQLQEQLTSAGVGGHKLDVIGTSEFVIS